MMQQASSSRFRLLHKSISYLIASLGLGALCLGDLLSLSFKLGLVVAVAVSWFVEGALLRSKRYQQLWSVLLVGAFIIQVVRGVSDQALLLVAVEFSAFLQITRLFNRLGAREAQQITVLAFLHLIAATVLTTSISYAVIFIGFVFLTPWMLTLSYMRAEAERAYQSSEPALLHALDNTGIVNPRFMLGTIGVVIPMLLMTGMLFVAFPRVGLGLFSFGYGSRQRVAGFGGQVDLGEFGAIREDPTVVIRVRSSQEGLLLRPESLRLRGTSFDHYDGRRWSRTSTELFRAEHIGRDYPILRWPAAEDIAIPIELEPIDESVIFLPQNTVALRIAPRIRAGMETHRHITRADGLEFRFMDSTDQGLHYVALLSRTPVVADARWPSELERTRYLQLPSGHERLISLANQVTEGHLSDRNKALALQTYLQDASRFHYNTGSAEDPGQRPLEHFIFVSKSGHCEYFASALAIMLRGVGIPSRHVTGFLGGRYNPYGQYIAVRQGDAHSWVEAFIDGKGWMSFDPTPSGRATIEVEKGLSAQIRAAIDALRSRWDRQIVSYDLRRQVDLWDKLRRWLDVGSARKAAPPLASKQRTNGRALGMAPWIVALAILSLLGAGLIYRFLRTRKRTVSKAAEQRHGIALYREMEHWLEKNAVPRPPSTTPLQHAYTLRRQGFVAAKTVQRLTDRYMLARYAQKPLSPEEHKRLIHELRHSSTV